MAEIVLERLERPPIGEQRVEIVERKGLGHPDSVCDAVMEEIARAINGDYQICLGQILHCQGPDGARLSAGCQRVRLLVEY